MSWVIALIGAVAAGFALLRWLRVVQREHYITGGCFRIALIWARKVRINVALVATAAIAAIVTVGVRSSEGQQVGALLLAATAGLFPWWLPLLGSGNGPRWTRRLSVLAAVTLTMLVLVCGAMSAFVPLWATPAFAALSVLPALELATVLTKPIEARVAGKFQRTAEANLARVGPQVVAVTGSWGKTTTKNHIRDLATGSRTVAISPASFNNRGGLSRTMNDHLPLGTDLLVVEMGMYGPGEIRELCSWVKPEVGVITAIGPMHLERVGSIEGIVAAKAELFEQTRSAVVWVEQAELIGLADRLDPQKVWRCGWHGNPSADVTVAIGAGGEITVRVHGEVVGSVDRPAGLHASNIACAVGALVAIGLDPARIATRLNSLQVPQHRATIATNEAGVSVLDDTFNSNPEGAAAALKQLTAAVTGRRVVVTPGMFELGPQQAEANSAFAAAIVEAGADIIIVGKTNRAALRFGSANTAAQVVEVSNRRQAVAWVNEHLTAGDGVLWENDLPDHYP